MLVVFRFRFRVHASLRILLLTATKVRISAMHLVIFVIDLTAALVFTIILVIFAFPIPLLFIVLILFLLLVVPPLLATVLQSVHPVVIFTVRSNIGAPSQICRAISAVKHLPCSQFILPIAFFILLEILMRGQHLALPSLGLYLLLLDRQILRVLTGRFDYNELFLL